jgi:SAM-dependent methyltransferase
MQSIDWNDVWKELRARRTTIQKSATSWGKRSQGARRINREDRYVQGFLDIMKPEQEWTVLDMGCGPGILTLPLASMVKHVTAADFSQGVLDVVAEECRARNITNVTIKKLSWEDDWQAAGLEKHDVVIASRSLVADDLREATIKLDTTARKKVIIATIVKDGPFDRRVFEAVGRPLEAGPDYICNYNLLYQMGILASVNFIRQEPRKFDSPDEAFASLSWMLDSTTDSEKAKLRLLIDDHLRKDGDFWTTDYDFAPLWAVIWWDKYSEM